MFKRLATPTPEEQLANFLRLESALPQDIIDDHAAHLRHTFKAVHRLDQPIRIKIRRKQTDLNRIGALSALSQFKTTTEPLTEDVIKAKAARIRKQFEAGGVKITRGLKKELGEAKVRLNAIGAEHQLRRLENGGDRLDPKVFDARCFLIREQFARGGVRLTRRGRLPESEEMRIAAVARRREKQAAAAPS